MKKKRRRQDNSEIAMLQQQRAKLGNVYRYAVQCGLAKLRAESQVLRLKAFQGRLRIMVRSHRTKR